MAAAETAPEALVEDECLVLLRYLTVTSAWLSLQEMCVVIPEVAATARLL